ncbi:glutamate--tRNA ligase [Actinomadura latina]|uniref:Glutamate--tRNA ligase n=1 Tax=Actinomadura latina TaxID=163603 RepID=A0A846YY83_9ACTN|nr:glutamate--tRNA ligase family protein [Actinomadura latina]NKZ03428.1 glutamate--tRNA ligase [Actinomadura latina]
MLERTEIDGLFPADLPAVDHWESRYPRRALPEGAFVTRFCPSPTGPMHIGGIYTAIIGRDIAENSGGVYFVRIEDTDKAREVPGAVDQFDRAFEYFGVAPTEPAGGPYGPYTQSARSQIYLSHVRELLRQDKAYLCFATPEELSEMARQQRSAKIPTGYYGTWAKWRGAPVEAVREALGRGLPYVVRYRSTAGPEDRISFTDRIRGDLEFAANQNDVVILKRSDAEPPLPTYHFAHVVDDHLMRVSLVIRGDEWLSSTPVHLQLFDALGLDRIDYAHVAPLLKQEGSSKRKLSKRKDPEASVDFYLQRGYPPAAVAYYLRGLVNGRLAEVPLDQALGARIDLAECNVSGALVDMAKLESISADHIADLPAAAIFSAVHDWASGHDEELAGVMAAERDLAVRALKVERDGVPNPRKDLRKWSDFRDVYGYFFPQFFTPVTGLANDAYGGVDPAVIRAFVTEFCKEYQHLPEGDRWFDQIREAAHRHGFARTRAELKAAPEPGSTA